MNWNKATANKTQQLCTTHQTGDAKTKKKINHEPRVEWAVQINKSEIKMVMLSYISNSLCMNVHHALHTHNAQYINELMLPLFFSALLLLILLLFVRSCIVLFWVERDETIAFIWIRTIYCHFARFMCTLHITYAPSAL